MSCRKFKETRENYVIGQNLHIMKSRRGFAAISRECAIDRVHSKRMINLVSALLFMGFLGWHEEFFSELYEQPLFLPRHPAVDVFGPSEG